MQLCTDFHQGSVSLENINGSFITLVPKKSSPETVNDFRPISLTNTCLKFLTKLVANRFQKIITRCIHDNQYGFIKSWTIQDCLAWCFEYLLQCKQSKRKVVVFKIDFEKAFHTIEHKAILQILKYKGFPPLVLKWVQEILASGSSLVLLNGIPGRKFLCKRGVRQGDPLSPILYVLGGDLLQSIINLAFHQGRLHLPLPMEGKYPVVQYADDTLVVLPADPVQLQTCKELLDLFASITGLKDNYHKSNMTPINISEDEATSLAQLMDCKIATMPFTYLGLPMGTTRPSMKDCAPSLDRVERRLNATVSFLSYGDNLVLVNLVLSSLPTYYMCTLVSKKGYTPRAFYNLFFKGMPTHTPSSWIWKSKCMSKHKFFAWLILHDRINTKDMLIRRHWHVTDDNSCVLCRHHQYEDWLHLFFQYQFSARVWNFLQIHWFDDTILNNLMMAKKEFLGPCFNEVLILAC